MSLHTTSRGPTPIFSWPRGARSISNQYRFSPDLKLQPAPYLDKETITKRPSLNLDRKDYVNEDIFNVKWRNKTYRTYDELAGILVDENKNVGERKTGLHLFTTSGFLDSSFFNRT